MKVYMHKKLSVNYGPEFSGEEIPIDKLWINLGGFFGSEENHVVEPSEISDKNILVDLLHPRSFDIVIVHNGNTNGLSDGRNVSVQINESYPKLSNDIKRSAQNNARSRRRTRRKRLPKDFAIIIKLSIKVRENEKNGELGGLLDYLRSHVNLLNGILHHQLIKFINELDGVEYYSTNYLPEMKVSLRFKELLRKNSSESSEMELMQAFWDVLGNYLLKRFEEKYGKIFDCSVIILYGKSSIEEVYAEYAGIIRRNLSRFAEFSQKSVLSDDMKLSNSDNKSSLTIFALDTYMIKYPYAPVIIAPIRSDPLNYCSYRDLLELKEYFEKEYSENPYFSLKYRNQFGFLSFGKDNQFDLIWYQYNMDENLVGDVPGRNNIYVFYNRGISKVINEISLGLIGSAETFSLTKPLPLIPHSDILLFKTPLKNSYALMEWGFKGTFLNLYDYSELEMKFLDSHPHSFIMGLSRYDLRNPEFIDLINNWNSIVWVNSSLKAAISALIPEGLVNLIATEKDVESKDGLFKFLSRSNHPIVEGGKSRTDNAESIESVKEDLIRALREKLSFSSGEVTLYLKYNEEMFEIEFENLKLQADKVKIRKVGNKIE